METQIITNRDRPLTLLWSLLPLPPFFCCRFWLNVYSICMLTYDHALHRPLQFYFVAVRLYVILCLFLCFSVDVLCVFVVVHIYTIMMTSSFLSFYRFIRVTVIICRVRFVNRIVMRFEIN